MGPNHKANDEDTTETTRSLSTNENQPPWGDIFAQSIQGSSEINIVDNADAILN